MTNERICANDTATAGFYLAEISDLLTVEARVDAFCKWFDCEQPNIEYDEDDKVLLEDNLIVWCRDQAVSIDWIVCGDPKGLAAVYRDKYLDERKFMNTVDKLDKTEQAYLLAALKANAEGLVSFPDAVEGFKLSVKDYQARKQLGAA